MRTETSSPFKTRDLQNEHFDSTIWSRFEFRDGDIVIASYPKCGTTWLQQIAAQLVFQGQEGVKVHEISPWLDEALTPSDMVDRLVAQTHRRIIKSHLPLDAMTTSPKAKYIYVARDGRDAVWSFYDMQANAKRFAFEPEVPDSSDPSAPYRAGPPIQLDPNKRRYFLRWLHENGTPIWPFWDNVRSWWAARDAANVLLVHFSDLKSDLQTEIRRIAKFLDIDPPSNKWPAIFEHCSFDYMKDNAADMAPLGGIMFEDGPQAFMNKGVNGRWRDVLSSTDIDEYNQTSREQLGLACALWLEHGSRYFEQELE